MEHQHDSANTIHLCCTCETLINHIGSTAVGYNAALIREWKQRAESMAESALFIGEHTDTLITDLQAEIALLKNQIANMHIAVNTTANETQNTNPPDADEDDENCSDTDEFDNEKEYIGISSDDESDENSSDDE